MTKYLGGHSDVVGGAVIVKDKELADRLAFLQSAVGRPDRWTCFLVLRGIKTLPIRMDRHAENAMALIDLLKEHPKVKTFIRSIHPIRSRRSRNSK